MITDVAIRLTPRQYSDSDSIAEAVSAAAGVDRKEINDFRIIRRSVDARRRQIAVNLTVRIATGDDIKIVPVIKHAVFRKPGKESPCLLIVGAGPAGLFAALRCLELGIRPIVLERGRDVDSRRLDLAALSRTGSVDPDSNYCFGEGGAGAFSDGKLFTRSRKRGNVGDILQLLVEHGADESILIDSHPHIGSDKLPGVIRNIRKTIESHGGKVIFQTRVCELLTNCGRVEGVRCADGKEFQGPVLLATGHSARDVYDMLIRAGINLEAKGFAIGVRLEHPQHLIDTLQYHSSEGRGQWLPAAEYNFVTQADGRGVYSFCMCPGGVVVPAPSAPGESVVNGMSASARASRWANSGMVVEIRPEDFTEYSDMGPLRLLELQKCLERKFFEESGNSLNAPAQIMTDFVRQRKSSDLPPVSYAPGVHASRLDLMLPAFISKRLRKGFIDFDRKCPGFLSNKAVMLGLESRTSSPVRIPRDPKTLSHPHTPGLYPAGEGAGFAGGIVSAAIDGRRCVDAFFNSLSGDEPN